ncbi:MAG: hypothetical protein V4509_01855 [Patescibacteria group bacterium]
MAQAFYTTVTVPSGAPAIPVQVGFTPAYIQLINLTNVGTVAATEGFKAIWQTGMAQGTAISTVHGASSTFYDTTVLVASGGISLLNQLGSEQGQYGAVVSGFTNASPGVLTVDGTLSASITAGCIIRVSLVADNQASSVSLNGDYYVASVTATTITLGTAPAGTWSQTTLSAANTTSASVYVSGGVVTLLQNANATTPNPPNNIYSDVPSWYNEAIQGFTIGTSSMAGTAAGDVILVACFDAMQP